MPPIPTRARPLVALRLVAAAMFTAALLTPLSAAALTCTNLRPSGPSTRFFPDSQLAVVSAIENGRSFAIGETPLEQEVSTDCTGVDISGSFTRGGFYSGAAQATPTVVRARASSDANVVDGAVDAVARGALVFKVKADKPSLPKDGPLLAFHIDADGIYGGIGSRPGLAAFRLTVDANAPPEKFVQRYTDTNGQDRLFTESSTLNPFLVSNSPSALAKATIDYEAFFPVGDAFFTIMMEVFAQPHSFSDFANTSTLSSITVLTPGYSLDLPEGLFVADPNKAGRYILADLGPGSPPPVSVPEPGTFVLLLGGLAALAGRCTSIKAAGATPPNHRVPRLG